MILSYHPIIEGDENIICAGRAPDEGDRAAIARAAAVILPQGCGAALYNLARANCPHVFPNLDIRFSYPGKRGQITLFRELGVAHPPTELFGSLAEFDPHACAIRLPAVIKLDWGGEGQTVFRVCDPAALAAALARVGACESTGQGGFLAQQLIAGQHRSLRVTAIGARRIAYWRIQTAPERFGTSVAAGARIDHEADPHLQAAAVAVVDQFCRQTGLQLAGFDFLFDSQALQAGRVQPLLLEINYFFGRRGLGGSEAYYRVLRAEIDHWLLGLGLKQS